MTMLRYIKSVYKRTTTTYSSGLTVCLYLDFSPHKFADSVFALPIPTRPPVLLNSCLPLQIAVIILTLY